jgi:ornithine decarboxylase
LFDAGIPGFVFPTDVIRPFGTLADEVQQFSFFGPTCDGLDFMNGPFRLPRDIREGDYIEIGQTGAYGSALRTKFNGFGSDEAVILGDAPLLSMYGLRHAAVPFAEEGAA